MHDMHNNQLCLGEGVVDRVVIVKMHAQAWGEFVAAWADLGMMQKRLKSLRNLIDESRCTLGGIFGDIGPNLCQIVLGPAGYS